MDSLSSLSPRTRAVLLAAALVGAVGVAGVAARSDGGGACFALATRLRTIEDGFEDTAAQRWEDIYTLSEDGADHGRILRDLAERGCITPPGP